MMSKKIIIVEPGTGNCYHSLAYIMDGNEILDCLYSDDDKLCNETNCPLKSLKDIWMAGFHIARNFADTDWDDDKLFEKWSKDNE